MIMFRGPRSHNPGPRRPPGEMLEKQGLPAAHVLPEERVGVEQLHQQAILLVRQPAEDEIQLPQRAHVVHV